MRIRGNIADKELFVGLLGSLTEAKKTGALVVTDGDVIRRIFFEEGAIIAATSTSNEESFANLLLEGGFIQEHDLYNAEEYISDNAVLLGQALVDLGVFTEEEVRIAIRLKIKQTVSAMFSRSTGKFEFVDEPFSNHKKVPVFIDVSKLLSDRQENHVDEPEQEQLTAEPEPDPESTAEPESVPVTPVSKEQEDRLLEVLEEFQGRYVRPKSLASLKRTESKAPEKQAEPSETAKRPIPPQKAERPEPSEATDRFVPPSASERPIPAQNVGGPEPSETTDRFVPPPASERLIPTQRLERSEPSETTDRFVPPPASERPIPAQKVERSEPSEATDRFVSPPALERPKALQNVERPEPSEATDRFVSSPSPERPMPSRVTLPLASHQATKRSSPPRAAPRFKPDEEEYERSEQSTIIQPRTIGNLPLLGVGLIAMLALLGFSYWLLHESPNRVASEARNRPVRSGTNADVEVPSIDTSSNEPNEAPVQQESGTSKQRTNLEGAERATAARETVAGATPSDPVRPTVRKVPAKPSRPTIEDKPVQGQVSAPAPTSASGASAKAVVDEEPNLQPLQPESVVDPERLANTSVGDSESAPASEVKEEQAEPSGLQPAVLAGKPTPAAVEKPSEPVVQVGDLVEPGPDTISPVLLEHPELKYPKEAKKQKIETVVRVRVLVDENGKVLDAELEEPAGYGLDNAALGVAARAKYIPATKGTVFVKMWVVLPLVYQLKK